MENCLVEKLMAGVNNNNLPVLGCIKIHVNANTSGEDNVRQIKLKSNIAYKVKTTGNYLIYNGGAATDHLQLPANASSTAHTIGFVAGEYDVYVEKYGITSIEAMTYSSLKQFSIDMSQFEYSPLGKVYLVNTPLTGVFKTKISDVSTIDYQTADSAFSNDESVIDTSLFVGGTISSISIKARNFTGSIDNLHSCSGNITLQAVGAEVLLTGDIKTFVEYMASHGVQNAVYTFETVKTQTTLYHDGHLFDYAYVISQGGTKGVKYTITNGVLGSPVWI